MLYKFFLILLYVAIFVSGINKDTIGLSILISLLSASLGLMYLLKNNIDVKIPKNFVLVSIFTLILHLYVFFINDKLNPFYYATIFSEGLIFWLIFYNINEGGKLLKSILVNLSITYSFFYIISILFNINLIALAEPFFSGGLLVNHWNIGDLWAFTLISIIATEWNKFKHSTWIIIGVGFGFVAISNVRSAMFALAVGLVYFFTKNTIQPKFSKIIMSIFIGLCVIFFVLSGINKTTIFDRPYFGQSIQAFAKHPFGVGMGNFKQISAEYYSNGTDGGQLATTTFNIFFEALSGVGIFSVLLLIFLISVVGDLFKDNNHNVTWGAVLLTILTNFMLDASYNTPSLMWIFFMAIAIFQSKQRLLASS